MQIPLPETDNNGLLPDGKYMMEIRWAQVKESRAGNQYISYRATVTEGDYKDYEVWGVVTLKPGQFGDRQRKHFFEALRFTDGPPSDTDQILHIPHWVVIGTEYNDYKGEEQNKIEDWEAVSFEEAQQQIQKQVESAPALEEDEIPF